MYITVYAKFVSIVDKVSQDHEDNNEARLELSRKLSKDISSFIKVKLLKETISR